MLGDILIMSELKGKEQLDRKLTKLADKATLNAALTAAALTLQSKVAPYPSSTSANRPGRVSRRGKPIGYYERGRGWWYPVMRRSSVPSFKGNRGISRGVINAKEASKRYRGANVNSVAGYRLSRSNMSQTLNRRWTIVSKSYNAVVLANNATYAPIMHDEKQQARVASRRNWRAYQAMWRQYNKEIIGKAQAEYRKVIQGG